MLRPLAVAIRRAAPEAAAAAQQLFNYPLAVPALGLSEGAAGAGAKAAAQQGRADEKTMLASARAPSETQFDPVLPSVSHPAVCCPKPSRR